MSTTARIDGPRRAWLAAAALAWAAPAPAARAGTAALPTIDLLASDGQPVLAEAGAARLTYLDIWASWCTPCALSFPWMERMHAALAGQGLRIVAVSLDRRRADFDRFLARHPSRFAVAHDASQRLGPVLAVPAMPTSWLLDSQRRVLHEHRGFEPADAARLERRLRDALA